MRIIAGAYRRRKLHTPRGLALRPTSDRLRETLFNILGAEVEGAVFVDLFAGSGAVGIEALSRGARRAIFVENHRSGIALLRRNLEDLGIALESETGKGGAAFPGTAELLATSALAALEKLEARGVRADLIFADPPWSDSRAYEEVLGFLGDSELVARGGRVIIEHSRRRKLPAVAGRLERTRVVEQGDAALSFYQPVLAA